MKSLCVSVSALLLLLAPSLSIAPQETQTSERPTQDGIQWLTDLTEAKKLAAKQRAPLFVVFRCEA